MATKTAYHKLTPRQDTHGVVSSTMERLKYIPARDMTHADIAQIMIQERARQKERCAARGVLSYQAARQTSSTTEVNKAFLKRTIVSVSSHNRREEEGECWRQRAANEIAKKMTPKYTTRSENMRSGASSEVNASQKQHNSRIGWATLKAITLRENDRLKPNLELHDSCKVKTTETTLVQKNEENRAVKRQQGDEDKAARKKRRKSAKKEKKREKREKKAKKKNDALREKGVIDEKLEVAGKAEN